MKRQESLGALLKAAAKQIRNGCIMTDIKSAGLGRGLQFELFKPGNEIVMVHLPSSQSL